ncbi:MAG TPA: hypothetical protein VMB70_16320 [Terriglobia bacterium]|nr:hypothetical protein [Terriglobia bacterium]
MTILESGSEVGPGDFSVVRFGGDDFSVEQMKEFAGIFGPAFGVEPFVHSINFLSSLSGLADVRVGSQHCGMNDFVSCGDIRLTSPGFAMPTDWPINTPFVATVPFTATGQLLVGGNQYDMVGRGTVTGTRCLTPCGRFSETQAILTYNFSVGEPPSLVLMLVSTIAIGIVFVLRRSVVNT